MFEWLFAYPQETYRQAEWLLGSRWPLWLLYLSIAVAGVLIAYQSFAGRALGLPKVTVLGLLQWAMLALLLVLLWQPQLVTERLKVEQNSVAIMLDTSRSMAYGKVESRVQRAQALLSSGPIEDIVSTYSTDRYVFSTDVDAVENYDDLPPPGETTRLAASLVEVLARAKAKSLAALVLVSDGSQSGGSLSREQLAEVAAFGVPVHAVGVGREKIPEDIELDDVTVPDQVLPNSLIQAHARIRHDGPGMARLKIYMDGEFVASKEVELLADATSTNAQIEFDVGDSGFKELSIQLDPFETRAGESERNLENNRHNHLLDIADQEYKVLYLEGEPRFEYKYIRRALVDDPTLSLVTLLWVSDNKYYRQGIKDATELASGFPKDTASLFAYDAVVIGSLEAPRLTTEQQNMLYEFVSERGGSLLMLGGRKGLAAGGWGNTPVAELLPARLKDLDQSFVKQRTQARLTPHGAATAFLTLDEIQATSEERWGALPPLDNYQKMGSLKAAAATLLHVNENQKKLPLLVSQPYGRGKSFILATGGTWRWQMGMPAADDSHRTFWRQLMRALVANTPETMEFNVERRDDELVLTAEVRNEQHQAMDDVNVLAAMSAEGGAAAPIDIELRPAANEAGRYEARVKMSDSGLDANATWFVDAIASRGGEPLTAARAAVQAASAEPESFGIRQDRAQLEQIAQATGGRYWPASELENLPEAIAHSEAGIVEQVRHPLWGLPAVFLLLILIKLAEWLLRRRWRQI